MAEAQNIEKDSGSMRLHVGTSCHQKDGKRTTGRHSTSIKGSWLGQTNDTREMEGGRALGAVFFLVFNF